jgi:type IV pilus assembly protein PilB
MTRKRLGEILVDSGVITDDHLLAALQEQSQTGELLGEVLVRLGYAPEDDVAATIAHQFGLPYLPVTMYHIRDEVVNLFPARLLRQYQFVPLDRIGRTLIVAAGTVLTPDILSELEAMVGMKISVYVAKQSEVRQLIEQRFSGGGLVDQAKAKPQELSEMGKLLFGE